MVLESPSEALPVALSQLSPCGPGRAGMLQGLCCESRLAQPVLLDQLGSTGLLLPAAIATESRGWEAGHVSG